MPAITSEHLFHVNQRAAAGHMGKLWTHGWHQRGKLSTHRSHTQWAKYVHIGGKGGANDGHIGGTSGANYPHIGLTLTGQTLSLQRVMPLRSSHVPSIWQYGHTHVQAQLVHKPYLAFVTHPYAACDASCQTRELFRGARARTRAICPSSTSATPRTITSSPARGMRGRPAKDRTVRHR